MKTGVPSEPPRRSSCRLPTHVSALALATALLGGTPATVLAQELFTGTWSGTYTFGSMSAVLQQSGSVVSGQITDAASCRWRVSGSGSGSQLSLPTWVLVSSPAPPVCIGAAVSMSGTLASSNTTITGTGTTTLAGGATHRWTFTLTLARTVDLTIEAFAPPGTLKKGANVVASVALVKNLGQQAAAPAILDFGLQDPATGSWALVGSRAVPSLQPGQSEPLPASDDTLMVPPDIAISIYRQDTPGQPGTYLLRACVRPVAGETLTANNCTTTPARDVTMNSACHVPGLDRISETEMDALELERERLNRFPPPRFVSAPLLNADLDRRVDDFIWSMRARFCPMGPCPLFKSSGFRPVGYTRHLHAGSDALRRIGSPPVQTCVDYQAALRRHFNGEHGVLLSRRHAGLMLNPPGTSNHENPPAAGGALAVDVGGLLLMSAASPRSRGPIDEVARAVGLQRPCWGRNRDYVHFQVTMTSCSRVSVSAGRPATPDTPDHAADLEAPVHLLVTDPAGRRIGFDPAAGSPVNDIGNQASYVVTSDLEEIVIDGAAEGEYVVSGVGAGGGAYAVTKTVAEIEGDVLSAETLHGDARPGVAIDRTTVPVTEEVPPVPGLEVALNAGGFTVGETLALAGYLTPFSGPREVDAYVVVQVPTGQFFSLQLGGALVPGIVPIARRFEPFTFDGTLARFTLTGAEPLGTYTWYSVLTEPGTLNFLSPLEQAVFTIVSRSP